MKITRLFPFYTLDNRKLKCYHKRRRIFFRRFIMYIKKTITRNMNNKHALFTDGVYKIFQFYVSKSNVSGTIRSYADIEAYNYNGNYDPMMGMDDGRHIEDVGFAIQKSELTLDNSIVDPYEQIESAIYNYLISHDSRYIDGVIVEEQ